MTEQQTPPPAPPKDAAEARVVLDTRIADKSFGDKVFAGDAEATRELNELTTMIAAGGAGDVVVAMSGILPDVPDSSLKEMAGTAAWMRDLGFGSTAIQETLSGREATAEEVEKARAWKASAMNNQEWTKRFLGGDQEAQREMLAANIILNSPLKKEKAA